MSHQEVAKRLEVESRTLRNWKMHAKDGSFPVIGRPKMIEADKCTISDAIRKEWIAQGRPGWRPVKASNDAWPTRLIQEVISVEKAKLRREHNAQKGSYKVSVLDRDVIWAQDTTFNNRSPFEVIKDRGSLKLLCADAVDSTGAKDLTAVLKRQVDDRKPPLVLMTDNGSGYKSKEFKDYVVNNKIIHLRSRPRCPEQNGAAERGIRELKNTGEGLESLNHARQILNSKRRYRSINYQTPEEFESCDRIIITDELRDSLYDQYQSYVQMLDNRVLSKNKRRSFERDFVFDLLEDHGFIKREFRSLTG